MSYKRGRAVGLTFVHEGPVLDRTLFPLIAFGQICKNLKVGYLVARRRVCFRVRLATLFTSRIG